MLAVSNRQSKAVLTTRSKPASTDLWRRFCRARLNAPGSVAIDGSGNVFIADEANCRIREVSAGIVSTVAGTGTCGASNDGGAATGAALGLRSYNFYVNGYLQEPSQVRVLGTNVYVADSAG